MQDALDEIPDTSHVASGGIVDINTTSAVLFVVVASCFLVMLYKLMSYWFVEILVVLFCIGGVEVQLPFMSGSQLLFIYACKHTLLHLIHVIDLHAQNVSMNITKFCLMCSRYFNKVLACNSKVSCLCRAFKLAWLLYCQGIHVFLSMNSVCYGKFAFKHPPSLHVHFC